MANDRTTAEKPEASESLSPRFFQSGERMVQDAYSLSPVRSSKDLVPSSAERYLPKFDDLFNADDRSEKTSYATKWPVDQAKMEAAAKDLDSAFNATSKYSPARLLGSGYDFNKIYKILENKTPEEIKRIDDLYTHKYGIRFDSNKVEMLNLSEQMRRVASPGENARFQMLIDAKKSNDVPEEFRITGDQLLKAGSNLKVGEVNDVKIGDRHYEIYVPKNADSRAPMVIAMHGAAAGDGAGLPREEMGMVAAAERTGSIVVFAYPKLNTFDAGRVANAIGANTGAAWNVPGRINLPAQENSSYSDVDYLDQVIKNVKAKVSTPDQVGLAGFSDGARFAQVYATERPNQVSGVYSSHGTWMTGEQAPRQSVPIKIVLGADDQTLPLKGGMGDISKKMDWMIKTNLELSQPLKQEKVWAAANDCEANAKKVVKADVVVSEYNCKGAPVVVEIIKDGQHAWDDHGNRGMPLIQSVLHGTPDRTRSAALDAQQWLKQQAVAREKMPAKAYGN